MPRWGGVVALFYADGHEANYRFRQLLRKRRLLRNWFGLHREHLSLLLERPIGEYCLRK